MSSSIVHDPARLAALRRSGLLDTPAEEAFDRLTRLAARATGAPIAFVSLVDADRQFFKSSLGLPEPWAATHQTPLSHSLCRRVVESGAPVVLPDLRACDADHPAVRELGLGAYLGVPVRDGEGGPPLGAFCLADRGPRGWTDDDVDTARELAAAVSTELELRRLARDAVDAAEELRGARGALEAREEFWRALLENASDVVNVVEPDGTIRYITPSVERLLGYAPHEMVGRRSIEFLTADHEAVAGRLRERARALGRGPQVYLPLRHRDGRTRVFEAQTTNLIDHPAVHGLVVNARDVTETLDAEVRLRVLLRAVENATEGIVITGTADSDYVIQYCNPAFERLSGLPAAAVVGCNCRFLQGPGTDPATVAEMRAALAEERPCTVEILNHRADGTPFWNAVSISPVRDVTGRLTHYVGVQTDVTAERASRDAVSASEARFRSLIENAADGIAVISSGRKVEYVSPSFARILGHDPEALLGTDRFALAHPDDVPAAQAAFEEAAARPGTVGVAEVRARAADGQYRLLEVRITVHRPGGTVVVNARDVTERRRAEADLRASEERFRLLVDAVRDYAIVMLDPDGYLASWNAGAERVLGYAAEEVLGRHVSLFYADADRGAGRPMRDLREAAAAGRAETEGWRVRQGGRPFWMNTVLSPLRDDAGRLLGFAMVTRDLTERRAAEDALRVSEALLRSVLEGISDSVYVKDLEGRYILLNGACARALGKPLEEVLGHTDDDLFPAWAERTRRWDRQVLETGKPVNYESTVELPGRRPVTWLVGKAPVPGPGGRPAGVVAVARDISERRSLEEQLRQAQKMEAVGRLAGGVAHDFNNLLMAIGGHAQLLLRRMEGDDPRRRSVEEIRAGTERAAALTRQLLAFSRRQVMEPRVIDPAAVVEGMHDMLHRLIGEDVELVIRCASDGHVRADPTQLEQVLMNLAVNARDAMPHGGVLVVETADDRLTEADAQRYAYVRPGRYVRLTVTDSGHGMDEATLQRVFEPFFTTKALGKGTGLGLSTVYGIVKQSEGYVWVESVPGSATTFRVYLPRVDAPTDALPAAEPAAVPAARGTVLLVEDDDAVRALARDALAEAGFTVLAAPGGAEALRAAAAHAVDLLLADVVMPGIGGPELARRVRELHPGAAVLFMSGYPGEEVMVRGIAVEDAALLQKPVSPDELVRRAAEALEPRRGGGA